MIPAPNTPEWLAFRKGKITASKIPIIMGESPYRTAYQLWQEEKGLIPPQQSMPHMKKGNEIEDEARLYFFTSKKIEVFPETIIHPENPLFMASVDGISEDKSVIVEIKFNNISTHADVLVGIIPLFHVIQMQWQMYVTGLNSCWYLSYRFNIECMIEVKRDDNLIEKMVDAAHAFLRCLDDGIPPPLTDRDYIDKSGDILLQSIIINYRHHMEMVNYHSDRMEEYRRQILAIADEKPCKGEGWKVSKVVTKGRVDYDAIPELKGVKVDQYRKPETVSYRITIE